MVGELFGSFALTVTAALLASLLVSLTVVPVLSYWFLRAAEGDRRASTPGEARRTAEEKETQQPASSGCTSRCCASRPGAGSPACCSRSSSCSARSRMAPLLKTNFFDQGEQDTLSIKQELAPGTSLEAADAAAKKVEKILAADRRSRSYQVTVGSSGFMAAFGGGTGANQASYTVTLKDADDYDKAHDRLEAALERARRRRARRRSRRGGGFGSQDLSVVVKAADADTLKKAVRAGPQALSRSLKDVTRRPERPGAERARGSRCKANDKAADGGLQRDHARHGRRPGGARHQVGQGDPGRHRAGVVHHLGRPGHHGRPAEGPARSARSSSVDIADVKLVPGPVSMTRIDGARAATITAKPVGDNTGKVSTDLQAKIKDLKLPAGATASIGGVSSDQSDAFKNLGLAMLAADRDRLHAPGRDVQVADPAADPAGLDPVRGDRRDRAADRHRHPDGRPGDDRHADADRHRGDQRDRADRPDQPVPRRRASAWSRRSSRAAATGCARS